MVSPTPNGAAWLAELVRPGTLWPILLAGAAGLMWMNSLNGRVTVLEKSFDDFQKTTITRLDSIDRDGRETSRAVALLIPKLDAIRDTAAARDKRSDEVDTRIIETIRAMDQRWQTQLGVLQQQMQTQPLKR